MSDAYALAYGFGGNATRRRMLQKRHAVFGDLKLITKSPPDPVPVAFGHRAILLKFCGQGRVMARDFCTPLGGPWALGERFSSGSLGKYLAIR